MGMTALWIGVVAEKPRTRTPSMSDGLQAERFERDRPRIVFGLRPGDEPWPAARGSAGSLTAPRLGADLDVLVVLAAPGVVLYVNSKSWFSERGR